MTAIELATGKVPLSDAPALKVMRERLKSDSDPPRLPDRPENPFSPEFREMVGLCLHRDASARPTVQQLLSHRFFAVVKGVDDFRELLSKLEPLSERYAAHKRRDENMDRIEQRLEKVPLKISFAFDDSDDLHGRFSATQAPRISAIDCRKVQSGTASIRKFTPGQAKLQ